jgi:hypothetical protein
MKKIRWNLIKNEQLKQTRGVSFKDIINGGKIIDLIGHPKRSNQQIMLILYKKYIWVVPFIEEKECYFLKTLYPSRKITRLHRKGER